MTIFSGQISLPLLALAGIALIKFALSHADCEEAEDRISQLPNDILSSIISRLTIRDVVRTTVLSRSWENVSISIPHLSFKCSEMLREHKCDLYHFNNQKTNKKLQHYMQIFVEGVDAFLRRYSGPPKIITFKLSCCFIKFYSGDLEKWLSYVGKLGVEHLYLDFMCNIRLCNTNKEVFTFPCHLLSKAPRLECVHLRGCHLDSNFNIQFNFLKILYLEFAHVESGVVESILSSCLSLEELKLKKCILPSKLCIRGLKLKCVMIHKCEVLQEIDIHAINLSVFEVSLYDRVIKFSCAWIPMLEKMCLGLEGISRPSDLFDEVGKQFGHVKSLLIQSPLFFQGQLPQKLYLYSNLRDVTLIGCYCLTCDIFGLAAILEACPYLETFKCMYWGSKYKGRGVEKSAKSHSKLKEVHFWGFSGNENEMELASYILKSAVALERMYMHNRHRIYAGDGKWRRTGVVPLSDEECEIVHQRLVGQAVSKTAELIVE